MADPRPVASGNGSHTPPSKCKPNHGASSTTDLQELSRQLETINRTLASTLRSQGAARSMARRPCQACSATSTALLQLKVQVDQAVQTLGKMRAEAGIQLEPKVDSPTSVANLFAEGLALEENGGGDVPPSVEEAKRAIIGDIQQSAIPAKTKSFKELMAERKQSRANKNAPNANAAVDDGEKQTAKIETLDDLITSCADCLTGSPAEYTEWLRGENVNTINDLAKMVEERPGMLVVGNGRVGMWKKRQFCEAVRAAASSVQ